MGLVNYLPEAYGSKPDPDEPWRYVCPDCGRQIVTARGIQKYRCRNCSKTFEFEELRDKKHE
jgi:DNA-directed RNA polymerase subunit RPC12/RpoP